jgi:predicted  nucleic acid-binding Zn-ribbon protein
MMVDRTPKIATLLRQKPAAERRIQGIGRHNATEAALEALRDRMEVLRDRMEVLRDRMEALRRDQDALRDRMAALRRDLPRA